MKSLDIGLSALRVHQQTLTTLGHNIANAATPGYHRQRVDQVSRAPQRSDPLQIGSGVEILRITRLRDAAVEAALLRNQTLTAASRQTLHTAGQIESLLTPGESSIHANLSAFFNRLEKVANAPQDLTVRREFLTSAVELSAGFTRLDQGLDSLTTDVEGELRSSVDHLNRVLEQIAATNREIFATQGQAGPSGDLLDRRDQLLLELAEYVPVDVDVGEGGRESVAVAGGTQFVALAPQFQLQRLSNGSMVLTREGNNQPVPLDSGRLRALLDARNETIPAIRDRVNQMAQQFVRAVDQQHAIGTTDSGAFTVLNSTRALKTVSGALADSEPAFAIRAGTLSVTVTDRGTGVRHTTRIAMDPAVDSLQDVAARLDAVSGIAADVDDVRQTLTIRAEAGIEFDFAGRTDNQADLTNFSGTGTPRFSGQYTGTQNDNWTVSFSGAGTVGVTPGLTATVRDQSGQVLATLSVGEGYEVGAALTVRDGVSLQLGSGTVAAADQAVLPVTANPDETGILSALGINSLFLGSTAGDLQVRPDILQSPRSLAGSRTGTPGDALNFARLAAIRDVRFPALSDRNFVEELADMTAATGLDVQAAESRTTQLQEHQQRLEQDRDAASGVDSNEEMLKMLEVERAYQAAARYITTVNDTLDELLRIIR